MGLNWEKEEREQDQKQKVHLLRLQVLGGGDPNVSVLLGVREVEMLGEGTVLAK